ncbi:LysM peptidoglycan-binding domain-containing protein [Clostridium fessum]|uniref:LysM peptidoglycan-binding domain-containing protein n=1 Tax=Clostridium fessum TaxID=2126740 RepID=UPI003AF12B0A
MSYSVYLKISGKKYKLPVNPEEIKKTQKLSIEKYQVLKSGQVSVPKFPELWTYEFSCELPHQEVHYMESGSRADPDRYIRAITKAQRKKKPVQLIYSNGETDDESVKVLIESCTITEKAVEEGDKYLSLSFVQYKTPSKKYVAVVTPAATVAQPQTPQPANPAVEQGKTYTVQKGDTLWKIAKQFYGNGSRYPKIVSANSDKIKNPNLIYPGQTFSIPS